MVYQLKEVVDLKRKRNLLHLKARFIICRIKSEFIKSVTNDYLVVFLEKSEGIFKKKKLARLHFHLCFTPNIHDQCITINS